MKVFRRAAVLAAVLTMGAAVGWAAVPAAAAPAAAALASAGTTALPSHTLTAVRTGQHASYDRVVFQFAGAVPRHSVTRVSAVYFDPKGTKVPLAGQRYLHVVFTGVTGVPAKLAATEPGYPQLLTVAPAGYFEGVASFGLGLASKSGAVHVFTLKAPPRLVIDVSHVRLPKFPGIWDARTWAQYWNLQYAWLNGHQPWLASPASVVRAWAGSSAKVTQLSANTFRVFKAGRSYIVTGRVPVSVPGPWVITGIR